MPLDTERLGASVISPESLFDHSLGKEILPNVQPRPPLVEL